MQTTHVLNDDIHSLDSFRTPHPGSVWCHERATQTLSDSVFLAEEKLAKADTSTNVEQKGSSKYPIQKIVDTMTGSILIRRVRKWTAWAHMDGRVLWVCWGEM